MTQTESQVHSTIVTLVSQYANLTIKRRDLEAEANR